MGINTVGLAYDRAGNLYVMSNSSERLGAWSFPKSDNTFVTPAPAKQNIVITATDIQSTSDSEAKVEVEVYPLPATDYVTVESKNSSIKSYTLYTLNGQIIKQQTVYDNKVEISLGGLTSKVYLLKVETDNGNIVKRILMK